MMQELLTQELDFVSGGDRWGDGQDQLNHPAPAPKGYYLVGGCSDLIYAPGLVECMYIKIK